MLPEEYDLSWNSRVRKDIQKIHSFLLENHSKLLADETVKGIFSSTEILRNNPERFPRERQLLHRPEMYRYIRFKRYKILFVLDTKTVHILHIFPERQHPKKIRRIF